jgi:hypothetical protein
MNEDIIKLITMYEKVLHGNDDELGLFNCYDTYYSGCWDGELKIIEELKLKLEVIMNKDDGSSFYH